MSVIAYLPHSLEIRRVYCESVIKMATSVRMGSTGRRWFIVSNSMCKMGVVLRNGCECVNVLGAIAGCQDTLKCTSIGSTRCEGQGVCTRDSYQSDLALMCHYNGGWASQRGWMRASACGASNNRLPANKLRAPHEFIASTIASHHASAPVHALPPHATFVSV